MLFIEYGIYYGKHILNHYYFIIWPDFMWYAGMWSPNGDQTGQWWSISMTSQWPLIMTSQLAMTLQGTSIVMSQWVINDFALFTYHCITKHNDIAMNFILCILCSMPNYDFIRGSMEWKQEHVHVWSVLGWRTHSLFLNALSPDWSNTHLFLL